MARESFLSDRVGLDCGDCREVLVSIAENSFDACLTDPPYHLTSIVKRFGVDDAAPSKVKTGPYGGSKADGNGTGAAFARMSRGFMGKVWDGGDIAFDPTTWRAVWRVLKPGAHLVAFGGTRTYARMAVAIEDAGFEIRDTIAWLYGSGFPKSHDVSKGIDRAAGQLEVRGSRFNHAGGGYRSNGGDKFRSDHPDYKLYVGRTDAARQWAGWGTALKPAMELMVLARKPLSDGTVAANVLRWGTGAINVDGCRIESGERDTTTDGMGRKASPVYGNSACSDSEPYTTTQGRWPANVTHDGSAEVLAAFPDAGGGYATRSGDPDGNGIYGGSFPRGGMEQVGFGDSGSAARFFYTSKADADDRLGSRHPTVKPLDLMQWLVRLVTPKGGLVLDPFAGTGTTAEAAWREGMRAELIEAEAEYAADIRRRMALALAGPDERARESIKAKNLPRDDGPLFAPRESWSEMWARPFDWSKENAR